MTQNKSKIENEYKTFEAEIEKKAEEEIKGIKKKTNQIREEAEKIGRDVELSIEKNETKAIKKKR
jgi:hypothetical protein